MEVQIHAQPPTPKPAVGLKASFAWRSGAIPGSWQPSIAPSINPPPPPTSNVTATDSAFQSRRQRLITPHPGRKRERADFRERSPFPKSPSSFFLKQSAHPGSGFTWSNCPGLFVNITDTLFIGNLFHTLFLLLPKVESSCGKYAVRQPSPAGGKGGEQKEIIRDACRILKIRFLRSA